MRLAETENRGGAAAETPDDQEGLQASPSSSTSKRENGGSFSWARAVMSPFHQDDVSEQSDTSAAEDIEDSRPLTTNRDNYGSFDWTSAVTSRTACMIASGVCVSVLATTATIAALLQTKTNSLFLCPGSCASHSFDPMAANEVAPNGCAVMLVINRLSEQIQYCPAAETYGWMVMANFLVIIFWPLCIVSVMDFLGRRAYDVSCKQQPLPRQTQVAKRYRIVTVCFCPHDR